MLDTRRYRTDQPGGFPGDFGLPQAGTANTTGTLTGADQERWLAGGLERSPARWNVIAQQVMMSRIKFPNPAGGVPPVVANLDQFDRPEQPSVAVELTATSISSDFPIAFDGPLKAVNPTLNPYVRYFDGSKRGYLRCELTRAGWRTDARTVDTIASRAAPVSTTASYVIESGTSTLQRA